MIKVYNLDLIIHHSRPQSLRSFWPATGIESSGSNHFEITKEITEFCPSGLTQSVSMAHAWNGCSQSSWFLPQARSIVHVGLGDKNDHTFELISLVYSSRLFDALLTQLLCHLYVDALIPCLSLFLLASPDEPYGHWPSSGAVRGRLSPGFGYGMWYTFVLVFSFFFPSLSCSHVSSSKC